MLDKLKRIGGSSVGAITAGLLAVGCTPQEIADVFSPDVKWLFQGKNKTVDLQMQCRRCHCIFRL